MEYITTTPELWKLLKPLSRENRKSMTRAEEILWGIIRYMKLGVKFRRQQVIDHYIVDFVALEIKLVIEVDGEIHNETKEYDEERTNILNAIGYQVIRFTNEEVINKPEKVKMSILKKNRRVKESKLILPCSLQR